MLTLNSQTLPMFRERLGKIRPDSPRKFGTMQPIDLFPHLRAAFEVSLGERHFKDQGNFFTRNIMKWVALYILPSWPKGRIKGPRVVMQTATEDFDRERAQAVDAMERFVALAEAEPGRKVQHFIFGMMPLHRWQRGHARHLVHHLEQFGA